MKKQLCTGEGQCQQEEMTADYREGGMSEKSNDIMLEQEEKCQTKGMTGEGVLEGRDDRWLDEEEDELQMEGMTAGQRRRMSFRRKG